MTVYRGDRPADAALRTELRDPVIGDEPNYFDAISKKIRMKQSISQSSAEGRSQE
ncbi:MAG: hypothetical protein ACREDO_11835 [Methyloceanibacter sp.]